MWELTPQSVKTVIDDKISLPRFQRKPTWNERQMFDLALSFYNGFPLGTVVVKVDALGTKYLLDGRQRRQTLRDLRDPERVYNWAKVALRFSNRSSPADIAGLFSDYVADYFGTEPFERETEDDEESGPAGLDATSPEPSVPDAIAGSSIAVAEALATETADEKAASAGDLEVEEGIHQLLEVVLLAHGLWQGRTLFTRRLDRTLGLFAKNQIARTVPGSVKLQTDSRAFRKWILDWEAEAPESPGGFRPTTDEFLDRLVDAGELPVGTDQRKLKAELAAVWPDLERTVQGVLKVEQRLTRTKIGLLEIKGVTHATERKIFELINSAGTPLTAAEILSASHAWNVTVGSPDARIIAAMGRLYGVMGIPVAATVVRWDVAATVFDRLDIQLVFGGIGGTAGFKDPGKDGGAGFERRITLGFKLLAGWYAGAIDKNTIADLDDKAKARGTAVPWGSNEFEELVGSAIQKAANQECFRLWADWGMNLADQTSDAAALNFALLTTSDWVRKSRPGSGGLYKAFQRNARVLLDRTVFEYITGQWGGAGDSRIRKNLEALKRAPANMVFEAVPESEWIGLLSQVVDDGRLRGASYATRLDERVVLLLLYRNVLRRLSLDRPPAGGPAGFEVDHIIPQEAFKSEPSDELRTLA
jgi:hypothetical protein